ncbi:MAG: 4-hydroxy-tetrahydrodipicolinate synthase [Spirochaetes bacterium GWB1_48_6]|nr:MAG: 4-hydroxy-tetrahydrodipicolinate synthase [Spirochaetes bacterium GWB1_48_6]
MFKGVYTALATPFLVNGEVDEKALHDLIEDQIAAGISGLVPMGTTGESPTLSHEEHSRIIEKVIRMADGRIPIIAGTGSNSTDEAIMLTKRAKDMGATACLQVVPYYNKPSQEGMYRHFMAIAEASNLPMIIYNIAGRTGKNMETDTLMRLAAHPLVVGVKEASGDLAQMMEVLARRPKDFCVLSGDDNLTMPLVALGGDGVISVASHLIPKEMEEIVAAVNRGDLETARKIHFRYLPLFKAIFLDTNPIPVKTALALQGRMQESFRLPLCPMDEALKTRLKTVMKDLGLLK